MRTMLFLMLMGCAPDPMAASVDLDLAERSLAWIQLAGPGPSALQTLPVNVDVQIYRNNRRATVILLASSAEGAGPCRDGECLGITAPLQEIGRATGTSQVSIPWTPSAPVGSVVYLQAALLVGGRVVDTSEVQAVTIRAFVPGCMRPQSPDYDAGATWDDGSCACPASVVAETAAELAPYLGCADLGDVTLTGVHDPMTTFPALLHAGEIVVEGASMTHLSLPALVHARKVHARNNPALVAVDAPSLTLLDTWFAVQDNPSLATITLPPTLSAASLAVSGTHQLADLTLPRMQTRPSGTPAVAVAGAGLNHLTLLGSDPDAQVLVTDAPALTTLDIGPIGPGSSLSLTDLPALAAWTADLPSALYELELYALPSLPAPDLSGVQHIESGQIGYVPWSSLALPDLVSSSSLWIHDASALTDISMPALTSLATLAITDNPALTSVSLPALGDTNWSIGVDGNPLLCATDVPLLAAPPPGCAAYGAGNACDP